MKIKSAIIALILILGVGFFIFQSKAFQNSNSNEAPLELAEPTEKTIKLEITEGSTFGTLMTDASISPQISSAIFNAASDVYDLSKIRLGRSLDLVYDIKTDELKRLVYQIDSEDELFVTSQASSTATSTPQWIAEIIPIAYEVKIVTSDGTIETSMYEAALAQGIDERAIIELADAFQWSVDFALDVRQGDYFKFIYEQRFRDGQYVMPGKVLAGKYVNAGTPYYVYYFEETQDNQGYFDQDGNSVQKLFLKAPVAFKYISSGFTTGLRYVQAFNVSTGHRAIDYAASYGTPIRTVGDGTVVFAGWDGSYGNKITIRHNGTYSTNYAHQSKFAVRTGQKVTQGQTIGYVGSTGFSTGPHLHFEMVKNGVKINPLTEILPPGESIAEENKPRFFSEIESYKNQLE